MICTQRARNHCSVSSPLKGIATMADDARISTALPRHPKMVKLQRRLGASGCWSLVCLFLWVAENRPEGGLEGMSSEDVEIAANWPGDAGDFVGTLAEVRFLDGREGTYTIHDWAEHNPWAASRPHRIEKARAAASARWGSKRVASEPNATSMPDACHEHQQAMPTSPHLASPPDQKSKAYARPSLEDVTAYCRERGNRVDPQQWFDHYSSNGWKVGRNSMKEWKAAVRTWERNDNGKRNGNGNAKQTGAFHSSAVRDYTDGADAVYDNSPDAKLQ